MDRRGGRQINAILLLLGWEYLAAEQFANNPAAQNVRRIGHPLKLSLAHLSGPLAAC